MPKKETFTRSECSCDFCTSTHEAVEKWDNYQPITNLQFRMKECVNKIEVGLLTQDTKKVRTIKN